MHLLIPLHKRANWSLGKSSTLPKAHHRGRQGWDSSPACLTKWQALSQSRCPGPCSHLIMGQWCGGCGHLLPGSAQVSHLRLLNHSPSRGHRLLPAPCASGGATSLIPPTQGLQDGRTQAWSQSHRAPARGRGAPLPLERWEKEALPLRQLK